MPVGRRFVQPGKYKSFYSEAQNVAAEAELEDLVAQLSNFGTASQYSLHDETNIEPTRPLQRSQSEYVIPRPGKVHTNGYGGSDYRKSEDYQAKYDDLLTLLEDPEFESLLQYGDQKEASVQKAKIKSIHKCNASDIQSIKSSQSVPVNLKFNKKWPSEYDLLTEWDDAKPNGDNQHMFNNNEPKQLAVVTETRASATKNGPNSSLLVNGSIQHKQHSTTEDRSKEKSELALLSNLALLNSIAADLNSAHEPHSSSEKNVTHTTAIVHRSEDEKSGNTKLTNWGFAGSADSGIDSSATNAEIIQLLESDIEDIDRFADEGVEYNTGTVIRNGKFKSQKAAVGEEKQVSKSLNLSDNTSVLNDACGTDSGVENNSSPTLSHGSVEEKKSCISKSQPYSYTKLNGTCASLESEAKQKGISHWRGGANSEQTNRKTEDSKLSHSTEADFSVSTERHVSASSQEGIGKQSERELQSLPNLSTFRKGKSPEANSGGFKILSELQTLLKKGAKDPLVEKRERERYQFLQSGFSSNRAAQDNSTFIRSKSVESDNHQSIPEWKQTEPHRMARSVSDRDFLKLSLPQLPEECEFTKGYINHSNYVTLNPGQGRTKYSTQSWLKSPKYEPHRKHDGAITVSMEVDHTKYKKSVPIQVNHIKNNKDGMTKKSETRTWHVPKSASCDDVGLTRDGRHLGQEVRYITESTSGSQYNSKQYNSFEQSKNSYGSKPKVEFTANPLKHPALEGQHERSRSALDLYEDNIHHRKNEETMQKSQYIASHSKRDKGYMSDNDIETPYTRSRVLPKSSTRSLSTSPVPPVPNPPIPERNDSKWKYKARGGLHTTDADFKSKGWHSCSTLSRTKDNCPYCSDPKFHVELPPPKYDHHDGYFSCDEYAPEPSQRQAVPYKNKDTFAAPPPRRNTPSNLDYASDSEVFTNPRSLTFDNSTRNLFQTLETNRKGKPVKALMIGDENNPFCIETPQIKEIIVRLHDDKSRYTSDTELESSNNYPLKSRSLSYDYGQSHSRQNHLKDSESQTMDLRTYGTQTKGIKFEEKEVIEDMMPMKSALKQESSFPPMKREPLMPTKKQEPMMVPVEEPMVMASKKHHHYCMRSDNYRLNNNRSYSTMQHQRHRTYPKENEGYLSLRPIGRGVHTLEPEKQRHRNDEVDRAPRMQPPEEEVEVEVISLQPIGRGVQNLEPDEVKSGRVTPSFPTGGAPQQVTTPPFPVSPQTPYANPALTPGYATPSYNTPSYNTQSLNRPNNTSTIPKSVESRSEVERFIESQMISSESRTPQPPSYNQVTGSQSRTGPANWSGGVPDPTYATIRDDPSKAPVPMNGTQHQQTVTKSVQQQQQQQHMQYQQSLQQQGGGQNFPQGGAQNTLQHGMHPTQPNQQPQIQVQPVQAMQNQSQQSPPSRQMGNYPTMQNQSYSTEQRHQQHQHSQSQSNNVQQHQNFIGNQPQNFPSVQAATSPGPLMAHGNQGNQQVGNVGNGQGMHGTFSSSQQQYATQQHSVSTQRGNEPMQTQSVQAQYAAEKVQSGVQPAGAQTGTVTQGYNQSQYQVSHHNSNQQQQQQQQQHQQIHHQQQQHGINHNQSQGALTVDTSHRMLSAGMPRSPSSTGSIEHSPASPGSAGILKSQSYQSYHSGNMTPGAHSMTGQSSPSVYMGGSRHGSFSSLNDGVDVVHHTPKFVRDTSKYWYKPNISREEAITVLKDKPPGTFIVRDSHSFTGAFGLALKVATVPPNVQTKGGDPMIELVRHFLIEPTAKGVKLKGCSNEPVFGSLAALVYQHSITPLALPCKLLLPEADRPSDVTDGSLEMPNSAASLLAQGADNVDGDIVVPNQPSATLLKHGAACNVLYLNSVDTESLTGPQAVSRAMKTTFGADPNSTKTTVVHFKVSSQGITLTDNKRKLFFRRHYPVNTVTYCGMDPEDRRWTQRNEEMGLPLNAKVFGFVARKQGNASDNACHLFAEIEPEQPASAIVNFVMKVMIGGRKS